MDNTLDIISSMGLSPPFFGILLLIAGLLIRYQIGRRRFSRRGLGGLQHFKKYGQGLVTLWVEWLFIGVANVLIVAGLWFYLFG